MSYKGLLYYRIEENVSLLFTFYLNIIITALAIIAKTEVAEINIALTNFALLMTTNANYLLKRTITRKNDE